MSENAEFQGRISVIEQEVAMIKFSISKELASRDWVYQLVQPIVENTRETRHAIEMQAREMQTFIAAHNKVMEERSAQEKEEHDAKMAALEAQTWSNILKNKWAPVATFTVALAVIINYLGSLLMTWMGAHGFTAVATK